MPFAGREVEIAGLECFPDRQAEADLPQPAIETSIPLPEPRPKLGWHHALGRLLGERLAGRACTSDRDRLEQVFASGLGLEGQAKELRQVTSEVGVAHEEGIDTAALLETAELLIVLDGLARLSSIDDLEEVGSQQHLLALEPLKHRMHAVSERVEGLADTVRGKESPALSQDRPL